MTDSQKFPVMRAGEHGNDARAKRWSFGVRRLERRQEAESGGAASADSERQKGTACMREFPANSMSCHPIFCVASLLVPAASIYSCDCGTHF
jgi:hypothetical protein